jgi:hypothetical protein
VFKEIAEVQVLLKNSGYFMMKLIALNVVALGLMVVYPTQLERLATPAHHWLVATLNL